MNYMIGLFVYSNRSTSLANESRARPQYPAPSLSFIRAKLPGSGPFNIIELVLFIPGMDRV
jgi:hypothetical protein